MKYTEMRFIIFLSWIVVVCSFPQSGSNLCGTNERGAPRQAGESWREDCNNCRCTDTLVPGCTKRFCGAFNLPTTTLTPKTGGAPAAGGVSFPGAVRGEPAQPHCTDQSGERREVGQSWKEDCNNCRCGDTGKSLCTLRLCIDVGQFNRARYLFTVDTSRNTEDIIQCKSDGAKNCKAVNLNTQHLSSSSFLKLFPGSEVELGVVRGPAKLDTPTLNYQFSLTEGGEGSLTYRKSTLATFGSFKPTSGTVHYTVESCGDGCNVLYERDSNYFNRFED